MLIRPTTLATAALLTCFMAGPALAVIGQTIDPDTLPPAERAYALHGKLYDHDPFGRPAQPGCLWSRLQIPTASGLRWMDVEDCNSSNGR